jgi:hypothetical protein
MTAHVDVGAPWTSTDAETGYSRGHANSGLRQVQTERTCFDALADIEPHETLPVLDRAQYVTACERGRLAVSYALGGTGGDRRPPSSRCQQGGDPETGR